MLLHVTELVTERIGPENRSIWGESPGRQEIGRGRGDDPSEGFLAGILPQGILGTGAPLPVLPDNGYSA